MKIPFSLIMAAKYLKPQRSLVSVVTIISMIGVMLGVALLIIVLSVMTGFDEVWRDRILGFNTHINVLHQSGQINSWEDICEKVDSVEGVKTTSPLLDGLVLMQFNDRIQTPALRGVDLDREKSLNMVANQIIKGSFSLNTNEIILGSGLARRLNANIGDSLKVLSAKNISNRSKIRSPDEFILSGIFHAGMYEIDEGYAYISISAAQSLYDTGPIANSIQVMLTDPMNAQKVADNIGKEIGVSFYPQTWMQAHQQIFTALQVEKNMMFFLLTFVALVAAFSVTNTLITLTFQKTHEIGLLKALGFGNYGIVGIFLWMGLFQGLIGTVFGIGLAFLVLHYRNELLHFMSQEFNIDILPPELYQLSQLPAHTTINDVSIVAGLVILFCILAGVVPAFRVATMPTIKALRFE